MSEDNIDFIKQLEVSNNNILDQLPSYNKEDTNYFINNLETEYDQQKTLNNILKNKDFDDTIVNITKFIDNNSSVIDNQFNKLIDISNKLKNIVNENKELQQDKTNLEELINSKTYSEIAHKLKSIKKEKDNIRVFLKKNGIISLI